MNAKEFIRKGMKAKGITQEDLAKRMGYASQSAVSGLLNRYKSMRVNNFVEVMNHLGYEVYVFDKETGARVGKVTDKFEKNAVKEKPVEKKEIPVFQYGR